MAAITDPATISYINNFIRPLADLRARLYYLSKIAAAEFTAKGLSVTIPNDASIVNDGSQALALNGGDGRTSITGADVNVLLALTNADITANEATSSLKLNQTLKVAVNVQP